MALHAAPRHAPARGPAIPPQVLQQLMAQQSAPPPGAPPGGMPAPQAPAGAPPGAPPIPPQLLQQLMAQKAAQGGQPQGAPPMPPPGGMPPPGAQPQQAPKPPPGSDLPPAAAALPPGAMSGQQANPPPQRLPPPGSQDQGGQSGGQQALMQQMIGAKQAMATGQPLPAGPVPQPILQQIIGHVQQASQAVKQAGGVQNVPMPPAPNAMPGMSPFAQMAAGAPPSGGSKLNPAEQARLGRNGDSIVAHLTPGEVAIPPQLQSPQLMQAVQQAFAAKGVSPAQFTAGNPQQSVNPTTGQPEFSMWSTLLPAAAMAATAIFAPELLGVEAAWMPALVGGVGAATSLATGGTWQQAALTGVGGAVGGYMSGLGGAAGAAGTTGGALTQGAAGSGADLVSSGAGTAAASGGIEQGAWDDVVGNGPLMNNAVTGTAPFGSGGGDVVNKINPSDDFGTMGSQTPTAPTPNAAQTAPTATKDKDGMFSSLKNMFGKSTGFGTGNAADGTASVGNAFGPALGGMLASSFAPSQTPSSLNNSSQLPPGWGDHKPPINQNFGQINGSNVTNSPQFATYNPYQSVTGVNPATGLPGQAGYQFFPVVQPT